MTPKEAIMKSEPGGIVEFPADAERILQRLEKAGFDVVPRQPPLSTRPVAWRVGTEAGGWILYGNEQVAWDYSCAADLPMQGLYIRPGMYVNEPPFTEETCPGHTASDRNPKICRHCGTHIDSLRPETDEPYI